MKEVSPAYSTGNGTALHFGGKNHGHKLGFSTIPIWRRQPDGTLIFAVFPQKGGEEERLKSKIFPE